VADKLLLVNGKRIEPMTIIRVTKISATWPDSFDDAVKRVVARATKIQKT
jgi:flavin-binding protein dodecin